MLPKTLLSIALEAAYGLPSQATAAPPARPLSWSSCWI